MLKLLHIKTFQMEVVPEIRREAKELVGNRYGSQLVTKRGIRSEVTQFANRQGCHGEQQSCWWFVYAQVMHRGEINVDAINKKLTRILQEPSIPPNLAKVVAMLQDSIDILRCIPTTKRGNCYYSQVCRIPKFKVKDTIIPVVIGFCKQPYKIIIAPNTRALEQALVPKWAIPLVHHNIGPIVINFQDNHRDGMFKIHTDQTFKAGVKIGVKINWYKARFLIKASLRYDCTKPRASTALGGHPISLRGDANALRRCNLNSKAPGGKYNKMYYDIQVRFELKQKKVNWLKFNYECTKCEDIVNKKGVFGVSGPNTCVTDVRKGCTRFRGEPRCGKYFC